MNFSLQIQALFSECRLLRQHLGAINPYLSEALHDLQRDLKRLAGLSGPDGEAETAAAEALSSLESIRKSLLQEVLKSPDQAAQTLFLFTEARVTMMREPAEGQTEAQLVENYLKTVSRLYLQVRSEADFLSRMPAEIKQNIFSYLGPESLRRFSMVSAGSKQAVMDYPLRRIYYAVGIPIDLYGTFSSYLGDFNLTYLGASGADVSSSQMRSHYSANEITASLFHHGKWMRLFPDLASAYRYCHFQTPAQYNAKLDVFFPYETPAVFLVKLKSGVQVQRMCITLRESWLEAAPAPPRPRSAVIGFFNAPASNLDEIVAARFDTSNQHRLFAVSQSSSQAKKYPVEFAEVWDEVTTEREKSFTQWVKLAVARLFASYSSPFYARLTRHHHQKVEDILAFLDSERSLDEMHQYVTAMQQRVRAEDSNNLSGCFNLMLDFTLDKLSVHIEASRLEDVNQYVSRFRPFT
ncbi:hypothetical protein AQUSIP_16350 [Aquicella siphonis]|uniref:F-box domain-containing protein n=1 Tax=Aquicella siphonis TaxID=254247 RepID=A0A5E4PHD6_9COXI|nr:F-box protein [Aquicella siphonis]VVC76324.1 hypothetical protein AQUSIP_16350 [Aquicella siphonis]